MSLLQQEASLPKSKDSEDFIKYLNSLKVQMTLNNGVLILKDLGQLRQKFLSFFQQKDCPTKNKIVVFDFLVGFLENNYGSDYELQFTNHLLPYILSSCLTDKGEILESAEEVLEAFIRVPSQLAKIIDFVIENYMEKSNSVTITASIQLLTKYIEYHPKIISAECSSFINLMGVLCQLKNSKNKILEEEVMKVIMNFIQRFPATMKDVSIRMENNFLSQLIQQRNDDLNQSQGNKKLFFPKNSKKAKSLIKEAAKNYIKIEKEKTIQVSKAKFSPQKLIEKMNSFSEEENMVKMSKCELDSSYEEIKGSPSNKSHIPLSDNGLAFNIFPQNTIEDLQNPKISTEERIKLLEVMISFLKSAKGLNKNFHSTNSFLNFILNLLEK